MLKQLVYDDIIYPEYYVDNHGTIYSSKSGKLKPLKPFISKKGYEICTISINGIRKHITVHRAVANAFIPNIGNYYPEVDHIDTNRLNNDVTNLQWTTRSGNRLNPITRNKKSQAMKGNQNGIHNFPDNVADMHRKKVMCVETLEEFNSIREASEKYNTDASCIGRVCNGQRLTACGYHWKYVGGDI